MIIGVLLVGFDFVDSDVMLFIVLFVVSCNDGESYLVVVRF